MHEILTKTMMPPADGLCGLLQLLEAGATAHADLWGCGRQTMLERYRCAWMIARGWVRIHRPIPRAPLTLRTWIRPVKHGLSRREFDLLEGDTLIAEAVQAWILVDLQTRRIRTIHQHFAGILAVDPVDMAEYGGLARAVGPHQPVNGAAGHRHGSGGGY